MIFLQARAISCEEGEKWTSIRTVDTGTLFGHELLKRFGLRQNYTNLNHGSFGALANSVRDVQRDFVEQVEARPDQRFRVDYFNKVDQARTRIERYVAAPPLSIVLLENASAGVNSVLRSIVWTEGDVILYLSTAYNMVKFTAKWLHEVDVRAKGHRLPARPRISTFEVVS